jgi:Zn-dependent protease
MLITLLLIIILIYSAVLHEYAHGWMARRLGDDTAEREGRLTLNPIPHLDMIGSIILPAILILTKSNFFIAWAKPVPYNPYNLRDRVYGELKVAAAGPITNFIIAIILGLIVRLVPLTSGTKTQLAISFLSGNNDAFSSLVSGSLVASIVAIAMMGCMINLMLGIFNLVPIPPLDGSKILSAFLPQRGKEFFYKIEQYGFILLMILLYLGIFGFVFSATLWTFTFITGLM